MSSDFILDTSNPVITINQAILQFKINKQYMSSQLNTAPNNTLIPISQIEIFITNITSNYVAYRTRITKKKYYTVEPTHLVISPNSNIKVKIIFYFNPKEKFPPEGHKFRFEGIIIPNNMKNRDPKEIFNDFSTNRKEVKGNSIKKIAEFIYDNNYNFDFSSTENIKIDLTQSSSSINSDFSAKESIYSSALGRSNERPSRISLRNKKNAKLRGKRGNENIDPVKLKEEYDKLQINNISAKDKFRYIVPDVNFTSVSNKMIAIIFGTAFFLGFYLTK